MITVAVTLLVVIAAVVAARGPIRRARTALIIGLASVGLGVAGILFLRLAPQGFLTRHPALGEILHPYVVVLYSAVALILGVGILLGLLWRRLVAPRSTGAS